MQLLGDIRNIWFYPVKSLRARALESAQVCWDGIAGDRGGALYVKGGHARVGKPYRGKENNLLHTADCIDRARTFAQGVALDYRTEAGERYFDAAPISLIFDTWLHEASAPLSAELDPLRFRPNVFAHAAIAIPFESALVGWEIALGEVRLRVREGIQRCVTITYDVQTGESNNDVLSTIVRNRAALMGVYCDVIQTGALSVGDAIAKV